MRRPPASPKSWISCARHWYHPVSSWRPVRAAIPRAVAACSVPGRQQSDRLILSALVFADYVDVLLLGHDEETTPEQNRGIPVPPASNSLADKSHRARPALINVPGGVYAARPPMEFTVNSGIYRVRNQTAADGVARVVEKNQCKA